MEEIKKNWIDEMIEREATPEQMREESTLEFCKQRKIPTSNYYWYKGKKENQEKILKLSLSYVRKYTVDVLDNLGKRAKNDNKATELYLNYVLELKREMDITSGGEKLFSNSDKEKADKAIGEFLKD